MVRNWIAHPPEWVVVAQVPQEEIQSVTDDLDLGELAAIALAGSVGADLLLIDDAAGRVEAVRRKLRVTGTLGVLRAAAEQGIVDVADMIAKLKATSFYVDDDLIKTIFGRWLR